MAVLVASPRSACWYYGRMLQVEPDERRSRIVEVSKTPLPQNESLFARNFNMPILAHGPDRKGFSISYAEPA